MFNKKIIRQKFRDLVFERDKHRCRVCRSLGTDESPLDAHHITDRNHMPRGGYVVQNGISLCPDCHLKAEQFHSTGIACNGYAPNDLYALIGSSYAAAFKASSHEPFEEEKKA